MEFHSSGEETRVPESDRITRRCSSVSEKLTNKETGRIHMVSGNHAAGRDGESERQSAVPPGQEEKIFRSATCFSLHRIHRAAPVVQAGLYNNPALLK